LGEIMRVETLDVTLMCAGDGLLRLNQFEVVGHAGGEAIFGLGEGLLRQIDGAAGNFDLLGGGGQVEQRGSDFIVDAAAQIVQLRARLLQLGLGFENVTVGFSSSKNRDVQTSVDLPGSIRL